MASPGNILDITYSLVGSIDSSYFGVTRLDSADTTLTLNNDTDINTIIDHTNYLSNKEDWEILYLAIDQLKPIQQQVIKLKKFHDFSIKEIARKINKSEAATKVTLHRSYHSLKKIMLKLTLIAIIINLFYLKIINIYLK